ncbi:MAG: hypothetical protein ACI4RC_04290 [Oscillospiraceae bacterium]
MSDSIQLSFDDGYKSIEFNNDPNKVIRINPTDAKFVKRISEIDDTVDKVQKKYGNMDMQSILEVQNLNQNDPNFEKLKTAAKNMEEYEHAIRDIINNIFGYDVCSIVFGDDWCISPAGGEPIYANFLNCIVKYIAEETEKLNGTINAKSITIDTSKTDKYISHLDKPAVTANNPVNVYAKQVKSEMPDISNLTPEQRRNLLSELSK